MITCNIFLVSWDLYCNIEDSLWSPIWSLAIHKSDDSPVIRFFSQWLQSKQVQNRRSEENCGRPVCDLHTIPESEVTSGIIQLRKHCKQARLFQWCGDSYNDSWNDGYDRAPLIGSDQSLRSLMLDASIQYRVLPAKKRRQSVTANVKIVAVIWRLWKCGAWAVRSNMDNMMGT